MLSRVNTVVIVASMTSHVLAAELETIAIAVSGQPAADVRDQTTYQNGPRFVGDYELGNDGRVLFTARLDNDQSDQTIKKAGGGLWIGTPGQMKCAVRLRERLPGQGQRETIIGFKETHIDSKGGAAFIGYLISNGSTELDSLWAVGPGGVRSVLPYGQVAPGCEGTRLAGHQVCANSQFRYTPGGAIGLGYKKGIWAGTAEGLRLIALEKKPAPSDEPGMNFSAFGRFSLNNKGQVIFAGWFAGKGVKGDADSGIWVSSGGEARQLAEEGRSLPDDLGMYPDFGRTLPAISDAGTAAFWVPGVGIIGGAPGQVRVLAKTQQPVIGFKFVEDESLAIWTGSVLLVGKGDTLQQVLNVGEHLPGAAEGARVRNVKGFTIAPGGNVGFWAELSDRTRGLWAGSPKDLKMVAKEGAEVTLAPGDVRTVAKDGLLPAIRVNDKGTALICLQFDSIRAKFDETQALLLVKGLNGGK